MTKQDLKRLAMGDLTWIYNLEPQTRVNNKKWPEGRERPTPLQMNSKVLINFIHSFLLFQQQEQILSELKSELLISQ